MIDAYWYSGIVIRRRSVDDALLLLSITDDYPQLALYPPVFPINVPLCADALANNDEETELMSRRQGFVFSVWVNRTMSIPCTRPTLIPIYGYWCGLWLTEKNWSIKFTVPSIPNYILNQSIPIPSNEHYAQMKRCVLNIACSSVWLYRRLASSWGLIFRSGRGR